MPFILVFLISSDIYPKLTWNWLLLCLILMPGIIITAIITGGMYIALRVWNVLDKPIFAQHTQDEEGTKQ